MYNAELFDELKVARLAYRAGQEIMSNVEYDEKLREYLSNPDVPQSHREYLSNNYEDDPVDTELLKAHNVGYLIPMLEVSTVFQDTTVSSMLSDANFSIVSVDSYEAVQDWRASHPKDATYILSCKIDGLRGNIPYKNGAYSSEDEAHILTLQGVFSRGSDNGSILTFNEATHAYLPKSLKIKQPIPEILISAEYYIPDEHMQEIRFLKEQDYVNNLSAAVSCARTGIPYDRAHLLKIAAHRVLRPSLKNKEDELKFIKALGIPTVPYKVLRHPNNTLMIFRMHVSN